MKTEKTPTQLFTEVMSVCESEQELNSMAQDFFILSLAILSGINGPKFSEGMCVGYLKDQNPLVITPIAITAH